MIYTTLNKIKAESPRKDVLPKLLKNLNKAKTDDELLSFAFIVESNGLEDALWATRTVPEHDKTWRLFAVWCARQVQYLMTDERSISAIDVAERYANGLATDKKLASARKSAWEAARAASVAAFGSAWGAACDAACGAASDDACDAAYDAPWAAAWAASVVASDAAFGSAWEAAYDAEWDAASAAQKAKFLEMLHEAGE